MKKFWNFSSNGNVGELYIYGEIADSTWWGDEVTPAQFKADLDSLGNVGQLNIYINSGGGDVFAGQAIHSMLKRHTAHKSVYIDGLAASIASIIAMAGDEIIMPANAMMMIHHAWSYIAGNKDELRKLADELEKIDGVLRDVYAEKTGLDVDEIEAMMAAETWLTAEEAVSKGFATSKGEPKNVAASYTKEFMARYNNVPAELLSKTEPSNGDESQPVEEHIPVPEAEDNALAEQRDNFIRIKRKLIGD